MLPSLNPLLVWPCLDMSRLLGEAMERSRRVSKASRTRALLRAEAIARLRVVEVARARR